MGALPELVSLSISAWSLKARFALKHHAVKYKTTPYMPIVGELLLRLRLGEWKKKLTVPVMFTPDEGVLLQSYDIAKWADMHSQRAGADQLFPSALEQQISSWNAKSDIALNYGRIELVNQILANPAERASHVPPNLRWLGPLGPVVVGVMCRRLRDKYAAEGSSASLDKALAVMRELQAALKLSGGQYLLAGHLTYADIAMAVAVQMVQPLGPPFAMAPRPPMDSVKAYQAEFADLIAWRDSIFAKHFPVDERRVAQKSKDS